MRYLETLVKTCTARVLGLPGIQRRGEDSSGKDGWRGGVGGQRSKGVGVVGGGGQDIDFWRNLKSWTTEIPLVSFSLHGCAGGKHHGVIRKSKQLFSFPLFLR